MSDIHNIETIDPIEDVRLVHTRNKKFFAIDCWHHHPVIQDPDS
jgi:hypothetical protein